MKTKQRSILIIDDDPNDRLLIQEALAAAGTNYSIHSLESGAQAIAFLAGEGEFADRERFEFPGIVITDLKMPEGDGFEVLQFLKSNPHLSVIPVLVLSASADEDDVRLAYQLGASAYMQKPSDQPGLVRRLQLLYQFFSECEVPQVTSAGVKLSTPSDGKLGARFRTG